MVSTRSHANQDIQPDARQTGLAAHSRRVAALALEIAGHMRLSRADQELLKAAALFHHDSQMGLSCEGLDRVILEARLAGFARPAGDGPQSEIGDIERLLGLLWRPRGGNPRLRRLATVVEVADFFDERLEFLPYERLSGEQIFGEMAQLAEAGVLSSEPVRAFAELPRLAMADILRTASSLKAYPAVALKVMALAADEDVQFSALEKLVSSDAVLAARLVAAASSGLYARSGKMNGIRPAISQIGIEKTRRICCAHAFAPLFASSKLHALWKHSLEMAQVTERLSILSGAGNPEEAFLAGLIHDIGRLALEMMSGPASISLRRLIECGCEPFFAEMVVCQRDHGEIGARVLESWNFPRALTEAVASHHCPEETESPLASLLYLAEYWSASEEDYPSAGRLSAALDSTGLSLQALVNDPAPAAGGLAFLFAA